MRVTESLGQRRSKGMRVKERGNLRYGCCGGYELWMLWRLSAVDAAEAMSCGGYELWMLRRL